MTVTDADRDLMSLDLDGLPFDGPSHADLEEMYMAAIVTEDRLMWFAALLGGYRELNQIATLRGWTDPDPAATREMLAAVEAFHADLVKVIDPTPTDAPATQFDESKIPF